jgi:cellulose binding protein with CBM2 domain/fibronectin type III domain protein
MQERVGLDRRRRWVIAVAAGVLVAPLGALTMSPAAAAGASATVNPLSVNPLSVIAASVSINAASHLATVPTTAIGINGSTYDGDLLDTAVPGLLNNAGVSVIRFPGGSESDQYNWQTNTDVQSGGAEAVSFDQFVNVLHATSSAAQAMITVNYGTGDTIGNSETPKETGAQVAADWVTYASVTHHDNIKYWEIGNEVYGNGTYGADWEQDSHCAAGPTSCGPAAYAANVKTYIAAMKAVDPTIVVGVVLTAPGNWPDGQTSTGSPQPWNQTVLSALGNQIGFADVHWYPQNPSSVTPPGPTDAGLLGDNSQIPSMVSTLRSELTQFSGSSTVPIMVTETNSVSSNPGKQTVSVVNALYLDQDYLTWLQSGVSNLDWWQIHNGMVTGGDNGSGLNGTATYGDYGVLSNASCGSVCEPAADTPFPAYYGLKLLGAFIQPGVSLVSTTSSQSLVQSYAATETNGNLRVLMVNDDPGNSYTVNLNYAGFTPAAGTPTVSTLSGAGTAITSAAQGTASSQTLPPYSVSMFELRPSGAATGPTTPGTPTASGITSTGATLTWAASTDPAGVTGYDVLNASNTVIASVTTNSAVLAGLTPATQYVLRVRAKDAAGNLSTPSASVTFTTAAGSDTTPPNPPGTPTASGITSSSVTLSWAASTDNVGVTGYDVVRINGTTETVVASPSTNSATITGLTAATGYTFAIYAKDAAGNRSTRSGPVAVTTASGATTSTCKVGYSVNDWGGGFTATIVISNTGASTLNGWTLAFAWPGNQHITNGWSATYTQSGAQMTATNLSYNGTIAPGGNTTIGFNASYTGSNPAPTAFTINGTTCATS